MRCGIPQRILNIAKLESVFLEGPEDDSIRIETCCPNTIINIIKCCCISLTHHCVFIYVLNTSGWQTLKKLKIKHYCLQK